MSFYNRRGGERGNGRIQGSGGRGGHVMRGRSGLPPRGPLGVSSRPSARTIAKSFSRPKDMTWRPDLFNDSMAASGIETGTKLYISNLDYGVSNEDIKELFSEVGHLKRFAVHYDGYGRPNGTAEVVFTRRSDAIAALKRYNNVLLDGKAMKIEVIGSDLGLPVTPRINVVGASNGRATRTVVLTYKSCGLSLVNVAEAPLADQAILAIGITVVVSKLGEAEAGVVRSSRPEVGAVVNSKDEAVVGGGSLRRLQMSWIRTWKPIMRRQ
ncbi:hypothetical protein EJB05_48984 [Eragrostis curvula]|uniref:RRM domain-containing protein n=1 Tax=Eragrostis curvula TaxID=38414 RepID=A0A5J9T5N3_9POAL|nr:hypothetical protein EJB05_48984 [Eragrostis curvula]